MSEPAPNYTKAVTLKLNPWWLAAALALLSILLALLLWSPWSEGGSSDRTITVSGETTLKAEPDEYVFYPSYEFQNADKAAGLRELTAKSDEVVTGLKKAGAADKDIKTDASGYRDFYYFNRETNTHTYTLTVTATAHTRDMAQKIQDYLATTNPSGAVTPSATFSTAKRKQLEQQGRDEATKDARAKADAQAKNLGFTVGSVKTVTDNGNSFGGPTPMPSSDVAPELMKSAGTSLAVQPGQNQLTYAVQVTYYIR